MKKFFSLSTLLLIFLGVFSQPAYINLMNDPLVTHPEANFGIISGQMEHYYDSLHTIAGSPSPVSGEKAYIRWKGFWSNRSSVSGTQPGGDIDASSIFLEKLMSNDINVCNSSPNGATWNPVGPITSSGSNMGMVNSLAIDPDNPNIIYAGTPSSGLWKKSPTSNNWSCITDNIKMPAMGVTTIDVDPTNSQHIIFASSANDHGLRTSYGSGIFETFNGGTTWTNIIPNELGPAHWNDFKINKFIFHPDNRNIIYAIAAAKFYKLTFNSSNSTWAVQSSTFDFFSGQKSGPIYNYLFDVEAEVQGGQIKIFVSSLVGKIQKNETPSSHAKLFITNDEGSSFTELSIPRSSTTRLVSLDISPAVPNTLYMSTADYTTGLLFVYKSTDNGSSWQSLGSYSCGQNNAAGNHVLHVSNRDASVMFFWRKYFV